MATDGHSKFLYISGGTGSTLIAAFSIATNGALTVVPGQPFSLTMAAIAGEPSGKFLLGVTGQASDNHIHVFGINGSTGAIAEVSGSPFGTTFSPINLSVHPNGAWVYSINQDIVAQVSEPMEGFQLDSSTGRLTEFSDSPFTAVAADGGPIEPSGKYIFALGATVIKGNGESTVTPFPIDSSTGALSTPLSPLGFPGIKAAAYAVTDAQ
jgi:6-phosphogluconolactonase (cycloisomerase 2 family)